MISAGGQGGPGGLDAPVVPSMPETLTPDEAETLAEVEREPSEPVVSTPFAITEQDARAAEAALLDEPVGEAGTPKRKRRTKAEMEADRAAAQAAADARLTQVEGAPPITDLLGSETAGEDVGHEIEEPKGEPASEEVAQDDVLTEFFGEEKPAEVAAAPVEEPAYVEPSDDEMLAMLGDFAPPPADVGHNPWADKPTEVLKAELHTRMKEHGVGFMKAIFGRYKVYKLNDLTDANMSEALHEHDKAA